VIGAASFFIDHLFLITGRIGVRTIILAERSSESVGFLELPLRA
jgi:hypothetical protein